MRISLAYPMVRDAYPDGSPDVNTGDSSTIDGARETLTSAVRDAGLKFDALAAYQLGEGTYVIAQGFSSDIFILPFLWPESGDFSKQWGQWMPEKPQVNADLWVVLSGGKSPVLSHLFINHMLSDENGLANTGYGLQAPLKSITPQRLVQEQFVPAQFEGQVLTESAWTSGYASLTLSPESQKLWTRAWAEVKAG
jgi:spermidine/putrescine transport system substrate-binding protein